MPHTIMQLIFWISILLFTVYAAVIIYYAIGWRSIPNFTPSPAASSTTISIIIPARNEAEHIGACLDAIVQQTYPAHLFDVWVIDDHSTDATAAIVKKYKGQNIHLICLQDLLNDTALNSYKKKAIETGIAHSPGELIVTTDADCIVQKNWLQRIAAFYNKTNAAFIAMPVNYHPCNRAIEIFQSLDFITLQGITGASVHKKMHSMCNGANLAYTREAFNSVNGFAGIDTIASGDDMLLMHKIYNRYPDKIFFVKSEDVIVTTAPLETVSAFFNQRIRWASKADQYDDKRIFAVLLLVYLFNVLLLLLPVISLFWSTQLSIIHYQCSLFFLWLLLLTGKTIIELIFLFPVASFFRQRRLLWFFPLAQPFHILYTVIAGWLGKFGSYQWKERKVK